MNYFVEIIKCQAVHSGISRYNTTTINIYSGFVCNTSQLSTYVCQPDGGYDEEVEGPGAHNEAGPEVVLAEVVEDDAHDAEEDLGGGAGAQRHQHDVGHRAVPDQHLLLHLRCVSTYLRSPVLHNLHSTHVDSYNSYNY